MNRSDKQVITGGGDVDPASVSRPRSGVLPWLAGLPALFSIVAIVIAAMVYGRSREAVPSWYRPMADDAFDRRDFRTAAVCYERILQSHPNDDAIAFNLAESLGAIRQVDAADSLLARLAPMDREGYAPAQLAVARRLVAPESPSSNAIQAAEQHLTICNFGEDLYSQANQTMAIVRALQNSWDQVDGCVERSTMTFAAGSLPKEFYSRLSKIARDQGNESQAKKWAERAS